MSKNDLEDRLVQFTVEILQLAEQLPNSKIGNQISSQIIRLSTSSSVNYGKAQSAASRKDFISRLKVVLKELRKTNTHLKMINALSLSPDADLLTDILKETDELIAIFVTSVRTATQNDALAKRIQKIRKYK